MFSCTIARHIRSVIYDHYIATLTLSLFGPHLLQVTSTSLHLPPLTVTPPPAPLNQTSPSPSKEQRPSDSKLSWADSYASLTRTLVNQLALQTLLSLPAHPTLPIARPYPTLDKLISLHDINNRVSSPIVAGVTARRLGAIDISRASNLNTAEPTSPPCAESKSAFTSAPMGIEPVMMSITRVAKSAVTGHARTRRGRPKDQVIGESPSPVMTHLPR